MMCSILLCIILTGYSNWCLQNGHIRSVNRWEHCLQIWCPHANLSMLLIETLCAQIKHSSCSFSLFLDDFFSETTNFASSSRVSALDSMSLYFDVICETFSLRTICSRLRRSSTSVSNMCFTVKIDSSFVMMADMIFMWPSNFSCKYFDKLILLALYVICDLYANRGAKRKKISQAPN